MPESQLEKFGSHLNLKRFTQNGRYNKILTHIFEYMTKIQLEKVSFRLALKSFILEVLSFLRCIVSNYLDILVVGGVLY